MKEKSTYEWNKKVHMIEGKNYIRMKEKYIWMKEKITFEWKKKVYMNERKKYIWTKEKKQDKEKV